MCPALFFLPPHTCREPTHLHPHTHTNTYELDYLKEDVSYQYLHKHRHISAAHIYIIGLCLIGVWVELGASWTCCFFLCLLPFAFRSLQVALGFIFQIDINTHSHPTKYNICKDVYVVWMRMQMSQWVCISAGDDVSWVFSAFINVEKMPRGRYSCSIRF